MNAYFRKERNEMNVLLVDDLPAIVNSLKKGVDWKAVGVAKLYTACSAKEAKLILINYDIDVLLCDIEMPEESGLELAAWTKEQLPLVECIFLTAHAEFDYIKQAMHIGSFDYILQPVKFEDVEKAIVKVGEKVVIKHRQNKLINITQKAIHQGSEILKVMLAKLAQNKENEANQVCWDYMYICSYFFEECVVYPLIISIVRWKNISTVRKPENVQQILYDVFITFFDKDTIKIAAANARKDSFWFLVFADKTKITRTVWEQKIEDFYDVIEKNKNFDIAVYPSMESVEEDFVAAFRELEEKEDDNQEKQKGIIIRKTVPKKKKPEKPIIEAALAFIKNNLNKSVSRGEVANAVHLSEEYFSRLFRQETGATFKDYILMMKMEAAKEILDKTDLSVSIVASKVGYSNFSYFSQTFKNYTGTTPQDYRKNSKKSQ